MTSGEVKAVETNEIQEGSTEEGVATTARRVCIFYHASSLWRFPGLPPAKEGAPCSRFSSSLFTYPCHPKIPEAQLVCTSFSSTWTLLQHEA